jgi:putative spermidine/putrescine transport system permease protein
MAKHVRRREPRPLSFYLLAAFFGLFVLFLYGPIATIVILSFQGPNGGLTFPMNGVSTHWFHNLFQQQAVGDFGGALTRSLSLGVIVMVVTVLFAVSAGLAFRRRFVGSGVIFYIAVASLIVPSILVSLGIGLMFNIMEWELNWYSSGLGAHLTWTLPFGLLIMFAVFNRFNRSYEEAARDLGATPWQTIRYVVLPIIAPSVIGIALFGFTLSYDEFARTLMTAGSFNTLPLEIYGMTTNVTTPVLYALGTLTTAISFVVILAALGGVLFMQRRRARHGSDAALEALSPARMT